MGAQFLTRHGRGLGIDQDEGEHARTGPVVDPGVHSASLDEDIAGFQMGHLTAVELEVALARQQQSIIDGLGCGA
jgi:hypothetical protein